jgi:hypothetical protein
MVEPVKLTPDERLTIEALAAQAGLDVSDVVDLMRTVARQEIASLAGLALRRLQDEQFTRSFEHNTATDAAKEVMGHLWGEVLSEYGG